MSNVNCWDGYVKKGTKMKNGKVVNNCVPAGSSKKKTVKKKAKAK